MILLNAGSKATVLSKELKQLHMTDRFFFFTKMQYALCIILYKDNNLF